MKQEIFNNKCDNLVQAGGNWDNDFYVATSDAGYFWTTTWISSTPNMPASRLVVHYSRQPGVGPDYRMIGMSIRPVR